jgi:peptidoglycan/xylan/chitin deacetylase (PgdA/CDA1 family)
VTILCYHSVDADWESPMAMHPDDFDRQCAWLARHRRVLPLAEALTRLDSSGRLPRGAAAITIDDGFDDTHTTAWPILARHGLPSSVYLVAQTLTATGQPVDWVDDPPAGRTLQTMSLEQVHEMQAAGVDFQSHSWAHLDLTTLSFDDCVRDLTDSRELLEDLLKRRITVLVYPRGRHNELVQQAAARAGYAAGLALPERAEKPGPFAVPRVGIHRGNTVAALRIKSRRSYLPLRHDPRVRRAAMAARRGVSAARARLQG